MPVAAPGRIEPESPCAGGLAYITSPAARGGLVMAKGLGVGRPVDQHARGQAGSHEVVVPMCRGHGTASTSILVTAESQLVNGGVPRGGQPVKGRVTRVG